MRLFFALRPPELLHPRLLPLMEGIAGARWQSADQLHITLRFVGDGHARLADGLAMGLTAMRPSLPPVGLSGVGQFHGPRGQPQALWLRATPKAPLEMLHHKLDRLCQSFDLPAERRAFLPHMTIARLSRQCGAVEPWLARHAGFSLEPMYFGPIALLESIRTEAGSRYEPIAETAAIPP